MRQTTVSLILIFATVAMGTGCARMPESRPINVLLISIDTLRADHLGAYGYPLATSPHIDALATESMVFEHCLAPVPITLPSHTSMLTGMYPPHHSVRDNGTFTAPPEIPTLATILKEAGYSTHGIIGSFPLHSRFGLSRGFDVWDEDMQSHASSSVRVFFDERPASEVARRAIAMLEHETKDPFFMFVHFFDVHQPWEPQPPYDTLNRDLPYDGEIGAADAAVGMILQALRRDERWDNTLVIVTSDHGEGLNDHEEFSHSILLYEETMHVPLIVHIPGSTWQGRLDHTVSLVDIAPTILEVLGIDAPNAMDGRSLLEEPERERLIYMESLAGRLGHGWNDIRASVVDHEKLILSSQREYYDLADDPRERHNLASTRQDDVAAAETRLNQVIGELSERAGPHTLEARYQVADDELRERLRALGYLSVEGPIEDLRELADLEPGGDPLQHVEAINIMSIAAARINSGDIGGALQIVEAGLATDPSDVELLRYLILAYFESKNFEDALAVFSRMGPRMEHDVGLILLRTVTRWRLGDLQGALADAERCVELSPETRSIVLLADILHDNGRGERALEILAEQHEKDPCSRDLGLTEARIARSIGRQHISLEAYQNLVECNPRDITARYNLGNFFMEERDHDAAQAYYQEALSLDPGYYPAIYGIASIALQLGDLENAGRLLRQVLELAPVNSNYSRQAVAVLEEL